ncbi:hypothetical protein CDAR_365071 [Caerostris darwini]|uniref:Uncharacterized protein n=1 Tax=Caerostris darwini TaxID=1538125 RepID=A0AAV4S1Y1_9ARAC|nr:hypothetical protein CDAR_365071 [Caerostris darwini]
MSNNTSVATTTPIKFIRKHLSTRKSKRTPQYIPQLSPKISLKYQLTCPSRNFERSFRKSEETSPTSSFSLNRKRRPARWYPDTIRPPSRQVDSDSCPELDIQLVLIPQCRRKLLCGSRRMSLVCGWSFFIVWFLFIYHPRR